MLTREEEILTPEQLEGAVRAIQRMQQASRKPPEEVQALLEEKLRLKRALMDPGLSVRGEVEAHMPLGVSQWGR